MIYNHTKKRWTLKFEQVTKGIVYIDDKYIELGYFEIDYNSLPIIYRNSVIYLKDLQSCHIPLYWDNYHCSYTFNINEQNNIKVTSKYTFNYPIAKAYNFSKLAIFPKEINVASDPDFSAIKNFTFGLEFETSAGNIPWLKCVDFNLVPLYDGSIDGHEYVTFPLTTDNISILATYLELLKTYTDFDKDCALHVHFGNFPIDYENISRLCSFWYYFQKCLQPYIPAWSFYVERYKSNQKAYNKSFPKITDLKLFYEKYTGNEFEDNSSLLLPNQYDYDELRKWNVTGRYFNMNIMHLISGSAHKTVEFRFLRPTVHYDEIKWYLLVLGAFLNYVIKSTDNDYRYISIEKVIQFTFSTDVATKLLSEGYKLYHLHKIQSNQKDFPGINEHLKETYLFKICKFHL